MAPNIDIALVRGLIRSQFPRWAHLPVRPVEVSGWDNRTFRLGEEMSVRLPSAEAYAGQVEKEQRWLPELAPQLPLPISHPLAMGIPDSTFPWSWSVYRWIEGEAVSSGRVDDLCELAIELAMFLRALQRIESYGGPKPGLHNFYRGGPLAIYDDETRKAIASLEGEIDCQAAIGVWEAGLAAAWTGLPVWIHGDVSASNLLMQEGRLSAVIDFGSSGVGDPACDLTIAWTLFSGESRGAFREALSLDRATWARARGWAIWKGLITLLEHLNTNSQETKRARRVIETVLTDHEAFR